MRKLNFDYILENCSQEQLIFDFIYRGNITFRKSIPSPFRTDKKPSFSFYESKWKIENSERYRICGKDYGSGAFYRNVIDMIAEKKNLTIPETLKFLCEYYKIDNPENAEFKYKHSVRSFENGKLWLGEWDDLPEEYQTFIINANWDTKILCQLNVKPVLAMEIVANEKSFKLFPSIKHPILSYLFETFAKTHISKAKDYKCRYFGKKPEDYFYHFPTIDRLPKANDFLILAAGEKDTLTWLSHGYDALCLNGEHCYWIPQEFIDELLQHYNNIVIVYDNDNPGLIAAETLTKRYNFDMYILPKDEKNNCKDITEFVESQSELLQEIFQKIREVGMSRNLNEIKPEIKSLLNDSCKNDIEDINDFDLGIEFP